MKINDYLGYGLAEVEILDNDPHYGEVVERHERFPSLVWKRTQVISWSPSKLGSRGYLYTIKNGPSGFVCEGNARNFKLLVSEQEALARA